MENFSSDHTPSCLCTGKTLVKLLLWPHSKVQVFDFSFFVGIVFLICVFVQKIMKMLNFSYLFDQTFRITSTNRLFNHTENTSLTKPRLPQHSEASQTVRSVNLNGANCMKMMGFSENVVCFQKTLMAQVQGSPIKS